MPIRLQRLLYNAFRAVFLTAITCFPVFSCATTSEFIKGGENTFTERFGGEGTTLITLNRNISPGVFDSILDEMGFGSIANKYCQHLVLQIEEGGAYFGAVLGRFSSSVVEQAISRTSEEVAKCEGVSVYQDGSTYLSVPSPGLIMFSHILDLAEVMSNYLFCSIERLSEEQKRVHTGLLGFTSPALEFCVGAPSVLGGESKYPLNGSVTVLDQKSPSDSLPAVRSFITSSLKAAGLKWNAVDISEASIFPEESSIRLNLTAGEKELLALCRGLLSRQGDLLPRSL